MASSDHGAQKPIRARGSRKCPHHRGKKVVYVCENCKELACAICVSKVHKGHDLEELGDVTPNAKSKLQDFINKSENHEIPKIKRKLQNVDSEMSKKKQFYQQEINQVEKQHEILREALDNAKNKLVTLYRDMEKQDMDILHNHKTVLQAQADERSSRIQECKDTLQSGNNVQLYDVSSGLPSDFQNMPIPELPAPIFIPGNFTIQQLEKLVGEVTKRSTMVRFNQPPHQAVNYSVVSQFTPFEDHWVKSIHPISGNKVWICLYSNKDNKHVNKMLLVNHKGEVQLTLNMEEGVVDHCVSPGSDNPWFCGVGVYAVREVIGGGGSVVRFKTNKRSESICLTADEHVVIGHLGEVIKYTQTGEVIHKTPGGDESLIATPGHISQCPNTDNLAVVDWDMQKYGGSGHPVVWILDDQLNPLYKYRGDTPGGQPLTQPFNPSDVCYTANGSLVITDMNNKCVLLIDQKGKYLQTLYTNSDLTPTSVCIHHDEVLWVTFGNGSVKLLKSVSYRI